MFKSYMIDRVNLRWQSRLNPYTGSWDKNWWPFLCGPQVETDGEEFWRGRFNGFRLNDLQYGGNEGWESNILSIAPCILQRLSDRMSHLLDESRNWSRRYVRAGRLTWEVHFLEDYFITSTVNGAVWLLVSNCAHLCRWCTFSVLEST